MGGGGECISPTACCLPSPCSPLVSEVRKSQSPESAVDFHGVLAWREESWLTGGEASHGSGLALGQLPTYDPASRAVEVGGLSPHEQVPLPNCDLYFLFA